MRYVDCRRLDLRMRLGSSTNIEKSTTNARAPSPASIPISRSTSVFAARLCGRQIVCYLHNIVGERCFSDVAQMLPFCYRSSYGKNEIGPGSDAARPYAYRLSVGAEAAGPRRGWD